MAHKTCLIGRDMLEHRQEERQHQQEKLLYVLSLLDKLEAFDPTLDPRSCNRISRPDLRKLLVASFPESVASLRQRLNRDGIFNVT